jgi:hypothetical protein
MQRAKTIAKDNSVTAPRLWRLRRLPCFFGGLRRFPYFFGGYLSSGLRTCQNRITRCAVADDSRSKLE